MPEDTFGGRTAFVTGGASGIGRALCRALGDRGARVIVTDRDGDGAEAVAKEIVAAGGWAEAGTLDVTDAPAFEAGLADCRQRHGRLDFLFNNAGIALGGEFRDATLEQLMRVLRVDLDAVVTGTHAAYRIMAEQGGGHIVNVASMAGLLATPGAAIYSTAKFGVVGLSQAVRAEGEALGVRVTVVCPGFIRTPIFDNAIVVGLRAPLEAPRFSQPAPDAARAILRGVERNRAVVITPRGWHAIWILLRWLPGAARPLLRRAMREMRQGRLG